MGVRLQFAFHHVYLSLILILKHETTGRHPTACAPALRPSGWRSTALMERPRVPGPASPSLPTARPPSLLGHCIPTSELLLRWPPPGLPRPPLLPGRGLLGRGPASQAPLSAPPLGKPDSPLVGQEAPPRGLPQYLPHLSKSGGNGGWGPVQCLRHKAEAQQRG